MLVIVAINFKIYFLSMSMTMLGLFIKNTIDVFENGLQRNASACTVRNYGTDLKKCPILSWQ